MALVVVVVVAVAVEKVEEVKEEEEEEEEEVVAGMVDCAAGCAARGKDHEVCPVMRLK
jgi:hypothetical protein